MSVDSQFFDKYFTVMDNLLKQLNDLQIQNNLLLQRNNSLLGALLEKPTILEAPQLTEIVIEQQAVSIPENVDVAPQFYYDVSVNKAYMMTRSFYISALLSILANNTSDSGDVDLVGYIEQQGFKLGLIRIMDFKYTGYNTIDPVSNKLDDVKLDLTKNQKPFFANRIKSKYTLEQWFPDRSDPSYYLIKGDKFREVIVNNAPRNISVISEFHYGVYNEISIDTFKDYMKKLKEIFS